MIYKVVKIYFDESGQSGCILQKEDILNFQEQPTFALAALVVKDDKDEKKIIRKYLNFKKKYGISEEIKGNELLTRECNEHLKYILKNIFDNNHFFILIYDKKFYLSTLLLTSLFGIEYQSTIPQHYYQQATFLSKQKDEFFIEYLKFIERPTLESFSNYLNFIIGYDYINNNLEENAVLTIAKEIKEKQIEVTFLRDFMTFGWYKDENITNLINLNALSELIFFIKSELDFSNDDIEYYHDNIKEFEDTFKDELQGHGINIEFLDSKKVIPLQIVDNVVSIFRHAYDKTIMHATLNELWEKQSEWDLKLMSNLQRKLSVEHINYTVSLCDWALVLCVAKMFYPKYSKKNRNNLFFNFYYQDYINQIYQSIPSTDNLILDVMSVLDK